jgi:outer membrane protein TolC
MKPISLVVAASLLALGASAVAAPPGKPAHNTGSTARLREIVQAEPTIKEVQQAALAYYQLEPDRIRTMGTWARRKGLFPEIDGGVDGTLGHNYTNTQDALYPTFPYKERQAGTSDQLVWHVRGVWDLSRLAYNPEQLDIMTLNSLQETLIREVTTMYFSRRRALAGLILSPPQDEEELYYEQIRIEEMTATIDAFTGGKFAPRAWHGDLTGATGAAGGPPGARP